MKRGLGTIRQDVNISIRDGGLIEVKGVQDLELIPLIIKSEVQRQLTLLKIVKDVGSSVLLTVTESVPFSSFSLVWLSLLQLVTNAIRMQKINGLRYCIIIGFN